mgnify:CR=1 FL=1
MRHLFIIFLLLFSALSYSQELSQADKLLTEMVSDKGIVGITAGFSINGDLALKLPSDLIPFLLNL